MRSGYVDHLDQQDLAMWRGRVASAIRGKRGQSLLRDCLTALDAMPVKALTSEELKTTNGDVCLLGAVGDWRNAHVEEIGPEEHDLLGHRLNVAACLIKEIEHINDEAGRRDETPEDRFARVRRWVVDNIKERR